MQPSKTKFVLRVETPSNPIIVACIHDSQKSVAKDVDLTKEIKKDIHIDIATANSKQPTQSNLLQVECMST